MYKLTFKLIIRNKYQNINIKDKFYDMRIMYQKFNHVLVFIHINMCTWKLYQFYSIC
jgi:hypothetical protein